MEATRREMTIWLTAMLEAEGTFTFQYNEQVKDGRISTHIQPLVIFVNSDMALADRVEEVMKELGFTTYRRPPYKGGIGTKPKAEISDRGFRVLPFLQLLRPFMVGDKAECVDCMIEFIEYRQRLQAAGKPKAKYSEVEFGLLRRVREINSGHWRQTPKFSKISTDAVADRREQHTRQMKLVS
jgi:hypothetical protein